MVIGLLRVRLLIHDSNSLKDKRSVLKRVIHKLRANNNCAVAEIDDHDIWRSAVLAIVTVYHQREQVESLMNHIREQLSDADDFDLIDQQLELL